MTPKGTSSNVVAGPGESSSWSPVEPCCSFRPLAIQRVRFAREFFRVGKLLVALAPSVCQRHRVTRARHAVARVTVISAEPPFATLGIALITRKIAVPVRGPHSRVHRPGFRCAAGLHPRCSVITEAVLRAWGLSPVSSIAYGARARACDAPRCWRRHDTRIPPIEPPRLSLASFCQGCSVVQS